MRFGVVCVATALAAVGCASGGPPAGAPAGGAPIAVKVLAIAPSTVVDTIAGTGTIEARDSVDLRPEAQGTVTFVGYDDGSVVHKGDVLVRLHQEADRARVADAEARLTLAQARLTRVQALFDKANAARQDLDQAVADRDLAVAARDLARDGLRKTEVRAPFDGVMGRREVSIGATVGPTSTQATVGHIDDLSALVVEVALPERDLPHVIQGSVAHISVDALPNVKFDATVRYVAPHVDAGTRTFVVRAEIPGGDPHLRPGLTAVVEIVVAERADALMVPTQAIVPGAAGTSVFVAGPDDKAKLVAVTTGVRQADGIEITDGLHPGDRVIVEGLVKLQPGAAVAATEFTP